MHVNACKLHFNFKKNHLRITEATVSAKAPEHDHTYELVVTYVDAQE